MKKEDVLQVLHREVAPTIGSLELVSVVTCSAYATSTVGGWAQEIELEVSPEIMKSNDRDIIPVLNVKGLEYAAALGSLLGNPERRWMLIGETHEETREKAVVPGARENVHLSVRQDASPWFVRARVYTDWGIGTAELKDYPGDLAFIQMAARKLWEKEPEETEREQRQKKFLCSLSDDQVREFAEGCTEKELMFLLPGLDYTEKQLEEMNANIHDAEDLEQFAAEMEKNVQKGSRTPCMTAAFSVRDGARLYLQALLYREEHDQQETLRYLAAEACRILRG